MSMLSETPAKRQKSGKVIGTHSGTFHADEALAVHLIRRLPEYKDADLVRTRDSSKLDECDIVVDVGGVYDDEKKRYDHHQRGFTETFSPAHKTKLSSAGLIYKHYGQQLIKQEMKDTSDQTMLDVLYKKLYENFVEALDAIDNGISQYDTDSNAKYSSRTDLSSRVAHLNPSWNEPFNDNILDQKFEIASALAGSEFYGALGRAMNSWYPARSMVEEAVKSRKTHDPSGKLIVFDSFGPWKEHLYLLEDELQIPEEEKPLYVLYPEDSGGKWRIQAVPVSSDSFSSRKPLPEAWRGIRDQALSDLSGIPGCVFVHAAGFIGGNETKEGALQMASKALAM
ncbi:GAMM1 protein [Cystobasidium minutum MCA 4210]|uniref:GAMM1 protein n=1 Tax=Cystobasidium minutum MCA 4210 TaxID=1397322 RepID=UPI0034CF5FB2|eukprot:jgi/Rhomi1/79492/CE79491_880